MLEACVGGICFQVGDASLRTTGPTITLGSVVADTHHDHDNRSASRGSTLGGKQKRPQPRVDSPGVGGECGIGEIAWR